MNNFKEIQELIRLITKAELSEFKMKDGDFELSIRTKYFSNSGKVSAAPAVTFSAPAAVAAAPASPAASDAPPTPDIPSAAPVATEGNSGYLEIRSPIVGTFYRSPSQEKPPYIKAGDVIKPGDVVCIVEAMKLFNEIESEHGGKVVKVIVEDASPVEFDQVLFLLDPKG